MEPTTHELLCWIRVHLSTIIHDTNNLSAYLGRNDGKSAARLKKVSNIAEMLCKYAQDHSEKDIRDALLVARDAEAAGKLPKRSSINE